MGANTVRPATGRRLNSGFVGLCSIQLSYGRSEQGDVSGSKVEGKPQRDALADALCRRLARQLATGRITSDEVVTRIRAACELAVRA